LIHSEKGFWLTIIAIEVVSFVLTRVVLSSYSIYSQETKLIRTAFRFIAVLIYWVVLREFIVSKKLASTASVGWVEQRETHRFDVVG